MELNGKTAVITGGGRGIGAAIARKLAGMGASTVICGRTEAPLRATAAEIQKSGGKSVTSQATASHFPPDRKSVV